MDSPWQDDPPSDHPRATDGEAMSGKDDSNRRQQVEDLVRKLEPEIIALFHRARIDVSTASAMLEEVVTLLLYRWNEVALRESWFLEMIEQRVRRCHEQDTFGGPGDLADLS